MLKINENDGQKWKTSNEGVRTQIAQRLASIESVGTKQEDIMSMSNGPGQAMVIEDQQQQDFSFINDEELVQMQKERNNFVQMELVHDSLEHQQESVISGAEDAEELVDPRKAIVTMANISIEEDVEGEDVLSKTGD